MTKLPLFKLEEFWKKYEGLPVSSLCSSDAETWRVTDILAMADTETQDLWDNLPLSYPDSPGHPLLRKEIAKMYAPLQGENVIVTVGAEEAIYCTMQTLISKGDHVVLVSPTYQSLETLPRSLGANITPINLTPENGWKLTEEQLQTAWRPSTKLLIVVCPHNPSGTLIEACVYEKMISLAKETNAYIFADEVYRFLEIDESKRLPSVASVYEKGISLNVMSKSFGLAGLRVGWIASQDLALLEQVNSYKMYTSICNSAPSEILALIALRAKSTILDRNRAIVLKNLAILDAFMERHSKSIRWVRPESGSIAFLELLLPVSIEQFIDELADKAKVIVMPGSIFDIPGNYFRIGIAKSNMPEVLNQFEQFLVTYENIYQK